MTFEEAIAQMRAGKRITRPEIRNHMHFSMAFDAYDHPFPVLLRHVNVVKPTEKERWRCFHLGSIPTYFVFAEDWEVFEDDVVKSNETAKKEEEKKMDEYGMNEFEMIKKADVMRIINSENAVVLNNLKERSTDEVLCAIAAQINDLQTTEKSGSRFYDCCDWIPCSKKMPEKDVSVLIYAAGHRVTAYFDAVKGVFRLTESEDLFYLASAVTHWMPLPDPPEVIYIQEARLIDANALYREVKTECNPYGKPTIGFDDGKKVLELIDAAPTIKAEPIRHGRWIEKPAYKDEEVKGLEFQIVCSECDEQNSSIEFDENSVPIGKTFYRTKFCPNCGAKMDGKC